LTKTLRFQNCSDFKTFKFKKSKFKVVQNLKKIELGNLFKFEEKKFKIYPEKNGKKRRPTFQKKKLGKTKKDNSIPSVLVYKSP
jgi:hypothetical protein